MPHTTASIARLICQLAGQIDILTMIRLEMRDSATSKFSFAACETQTCLPDSIAKRFTWFAEFGPCSADMKERHSHSSPSLLKLFRSSSYDLQLSFKSICNHGWCLQRHPRAYYISLCLQLQSFAVAVKVLPNIVNVNYPRQVAFLLSLHNLHVHTANQAGPLAFRSKGQ